MHSNSLWKMEYLENLWSAQWCTPKKLECRVVHSKHSLKMVFLVCIIVHSKKRGVHSYAHQKWCARGNFLVCIKADPSFTIGVLHSVNVVCFCTFTTLKSGLSPDFAYRWGQRYVWDFFNFILKAFLQASKHRNRILSIEIWAWKIWKQLGKLNDLTDWETVCLLLSWWIHNNTDESRMEIW